MITVLLFAKFREAAGQGELSVEPRPDLSADQLWSELSLAFPGLQTTAGAILPTVAINRTVASPVTLLADGDEVAFLPPVSGG